MSSNNSNHYQLLEVPIDADVNAIKKAYKKKILQIHPDKNTVQSSNAGHLVNLYKEAFAVLSHEDSRTKYDAYLSEDSKKQGLILSGDGLDIYSLEDFIVQDDNLWVKDCPRCESEKSMQLTEDDLEKGTEDGEGGYEVVVQCTSCSLWIKIKYMEAEDDQDKDY